MIEAQKLRGADQSARGGFDALCKLGTGAPDAAQDVVEVGRRRPRLPGNLRNREASGENAVLHTHTRKPNSETLPRQALRSDCGKLKPGHHPVMAWARVDAFREAVRQYQERTGKTQAQVAEDLGTTYGTLRFWLSGTRPPKKENLTKAAEVFGCSITRFWDDPGERPDWLAGLSETSRAQFDSLARAWGGDDLSDEERTILFNRILTEKAQLLAMRDQIRRMNRK